MGTLTLSLENEDETRLRVLAQEKYMGKKGSLSKVISEGLRKLEEETVRQRAIESLIKKMNKGFDMGKIQIKHRSELYDR
ncbi:MAG: hypothetical protein JW703_05135 [Candidatus Diapherotrites archaeon]|nr:hypothetical protein [Candidatus Diapherotrites archaeon]